MEYVRLGNSGLKISKIVLGCMSFGEDRDAWSLPEKEALPIIKHAFDLGINTWDTADIYAYGDSERIVGKALKVYDIPRSKVVIFSKCLAGIPDNPYELSTPERLQQMTVNDGVMVNRIGLSRKHILDAVEASVERLGTYLDVLQIHRLDHDVPMEEIMKALNDVVESGKVRYIGASSMAAWEFQAMQNVAKQNGWHQFISMQNLHTLIYREEEREMIPYCRATGVGLIPWSPLARGRLTRPYNSEATLRAKTDEFADMLIGPTTEVDIKIIGRVEELAKKKGVSMATIATIWSLTKGLNPILGLSSTKRVDEAVDAVKHIKADLLTAEDIAFLDELYVPKPVAGFR